MEPERVERFWNYVDRPSLYACWEWQAGTFAERGGYGQFNVARGKPRGAHRVAWELLVGPIPEGLTLDHLCRNTSCVNPQHLEPVTLAENVRRSPISGVAALNREKTHCVQGHPYDAENTRIGYSNGRPTRRCHQCRLISQRGTRARARAKASR